MRELGIQAARAGKHVLVEKPIEITPQSAHALINECECANVKLGVIFQSRFLPAVERLKGAIEDGSFGSLYLGDAYVKWFRTPEYYAQGSWHGTQSLDGGGALINQAIHTVDLLRWMMGPVESLFAYKSALRYPHIESEDTLVASLRFASGALGVIEATTSIAPGFKRRLEYQARKEQPFWMATTSPSCHLWDDRTIQVWPVNRLLTAQPIPRRSPIAVTHARSRTWCARLMRVVSL